jgi:hypothetical protein
MKETSNFNRLKESVLKHSSKIKNWEDAKSEWFVKECYLDADNCTCGHDILNVFIIENKITKASLKVGSSCINHFKDFYMSQNAKRMLKKQKYLKSQQEKLNKTTEEDLIEHHINSFIKKCFDKRVINEWEHTFYYNVKRFKTLSPKQSETLDKIKKKMNVFAANNPYDKDVITLKVILKINAEHNR